MALPAGVVVSRPLLMQKQVDAERVKLGQERHKVFQAAAQAYGQARVKAFATRASLTGMDSGRNVHIDYRWTVRDL